MFFGSLGSTSGEDNLSPRLLGFPFLQSSDFRECPLFGMMAHRARIHDHDGSFIWILGESQSPGFQMTSHLIGIGNIHLAAVRTNEEFHCLDSIQGAPAAETLD